MRGFGSDTILALGAVSLGRMNSLGGFDDSGPNWTFGEDVVDMGFKALFDEEDEELALVFILFIASRLRIDQLIC